MFLDKKCLCHFLIREENREVLKMPAVLNFHMLKTLNQSVDSLGDREVLGVASWVKRQIGTSARGSQCCRLDRGDVSMRSLLLWKLAVWSPWVEWIWLGTINIVSRYGATGSTSIKESGFSSCHLVVRSWWALVTGEKPCCHPSFAMVALPLRRICGMALKNSTIHSPGLF